MSWSRRALTRLERRAVVLENGVFHCSRSIVGAMCSLLPWFDGSDQRLFKRDAFVRLGRDMEHLIERSTVRPMGRNARK